MGQTERVRGDRWAESERAKGAFVMKLPASTTAGIPDWLHVCKAHGITLVEAKTLEAVFNAGGSPAQACSVAQRFILRMVSKYGGRAHVLVLAPDHYVNLPWTGAQRELSKAHRWSTYE